MILVIEMDILAKFQDAQLKELLSLSSKDQIYLIAREGGVVPASMIPLFTQISAKLEVKTLPNKDSGFEKGFLFGSLSKASGKEKVVILSGEARPAILDDNCSWNEGFGMSKTARKRTAKPKGTVADTAVPSPEQVPAAPKEEKNAAAPVKNRKGAGSAKKPAATLVDLFSHPAVSECINLIIGKEDTFKKCLTEASDSEIGYKMLLGLHFGADGDTIWEKTHKEFKKLRKLC